MALADEIKNRLEELIGRGNKFIPQRHREREYGPAFWVHDELISSIQAWMTSGANLILLITPPASYFREELARITENDQLKGGAPWALVQKMNGLLVSLKEEAEHGLVQRIEDVVVATAFDDFLDHASAFHKANHAREAGVLAAIVLEDTIKRIATRNSVKSDGLSLEQLIDELVKANVFTPVKAKRVKGYAGVRNPALHAEWDKFDIKDAGELISGTRELLDSYL
jgi:hypothetical protein